MRTKTDICLYSSFVIVVCIFSLELHLEYLQSFTIAPTMVHLCSLNHIKGTLYLDLSTWVCNCISRGVKKNLHSSESKQMRWVAKRI